ncbi:MAG: glutamine synthetase, partial [Acetobacteraceae bacterium]
GTYALDSFRRQGSYGAVLVAALRRAGVTPDSCLPEYGARQFEYTVAPAVGLRAADDAIIAREMARAVAHRLGHRAILAPILSPDGIGNGTHIHLSLEDHAGATALYDPAAPDGLSDIGRHFAAGILHHMPALAAVTAPSVASYIRLRPNRWAPTWASLGAGDRGSALRICPIFAPETPDDAARQFNIEYRVADATASPYMALGAIVHAGTDGIRRKLVPPAVPAVEFWSMTDAARAAAGIPRLPASLAEALAALAATEAAPRWFGPRLLDCYLRLKRAEIAALDGLGEAAICARYADAY